MTGDEFIELAGKLSANASAGEAVYRTAVSRAYYGAFHMAKDFLKSLGCGVSDGSASHGLVPLCLTNSGQPDADLAGQLLSQLHGFRIDADYRLQRASAGTVAKARLGVEFSHRIRTALDKCSKEPARTQLAAGIVAYRAIIKM